MSTHQRENEHESDFSIFDNPVYGACDDCKAVVNKFYSLDVYKEEK